MEKIDRNKTCAEAIRSIADGIVAAHEEFKEKTFEFEASWIRKDNGFVHERIDWDVR